MPIGHIVRLIFNETSVDYKNSSTLGVNLCPNFSSHRKIAGPKAAPQ